MIKYKFGLVKLEASLEVGFKIRVRTKKGSFKVCMWFVVQCLTRKQEQQEFSGCVEDWVRTKMLLNKY